LGPHSSGKHGCELVNSSTSGRSTQCLSHPAGCDRCHWMCCPQCQLLLLLLVLVQALLYVVFVPLQTLDTVVLDSCLHCTVLLLAVLLLPSLIRQYSIGNAKGSQPPAYVFGQVFLPRTVARILQAAEHTLSSACAEQRQYSAVPVNHAHALIYQRHFGREQRVNVSSGTSCSQSASDHRHSTELGRTWYGAGTEPVRREHM